MGLKVANLLESPEYSAVPYAYGAKSVKYALAPCGSVPPVNPTSRAPQSDSENYLEEAMNRTLLESRAQGGVCYSMFIQQPKGNDSVENPTQAWNGGFEQVAKILIPNGQQREGLLDYRSNDAECERMAFDPFNVPAANRPISKTNLTRKYVYAALANFRRSEMPKLFARWKKNHDDAAIPSAILDELKKLKNPDGASPKLQDQTQPKVDEGFRQLGIVK
jgi:hypothetical protein